MHKLGLLLTAIITLAATYDTDARVKSITTDNAQYEFGYENNKLSQILVKKDGKYSRGFYVDQNNATTFSYKCWTDYDEAQNAFLTYDAKTTLTFNPAQHSLTERCDEINADKEVTSSDLYYFDEKSATFNGTPLSKYKSTKDGINSVEVIKEGAKVSIKYSDMQLLNYDGQVNYMAYILEALMGWDYPFSLWFPGTDSCFNPISRIPEKITVKGNGYNYYYSFDLDTLSLLTDNKTLRFEVKLVVRGELRTRNHYTVTFE